MDKKIEENLDKISSGDLALKFNLVANILSSEPKQSPELEKILNFTEEFKKFMDWESSVSNEVEQLEKLIGLETELKKIDSFREIQTKNIIAIGGGFSSGKSTFINGWIENPKIQLPVGINPVTAIPTYILSGKENKIEGITNQGNYIIIEEDLYGKLDHDFIQSFGFNLKSILPFFMIKTSLKGYKNITFIDTPGYNPSKTEGFTAEDEKTAQDFLEEANSLIWLLGLDATGTIPQTDLDFLNKLQLQGKSLYILANKAELKNPSDLENILDEIEEKLEEEDIEFEGISAYSSTQKKEYAYRKKSLHEFLQEQEGKSNLSLVKLINKKLEEIFETYQKAIQKEKEEQESIQKEIKSLQVETMKMKDDSLGDKFESKLESISTRLKKQEFEKQLQTLQELKKKMEDSLQQFFDLGKSEVEELEKEKAKKLESEEELKREKAKILASKEELKKEKVKELESELNLLLKTKDKLLGTDETEKKKQNSKEIIEIFNQLIKIDPVNADYYNDLGDVYYHVLHDYEEAIEDYTKSIKIDPGNADYYNNRGNAYYKLDDYEQAIEDYNKAIKINPRNAEYYKNRGDAYCNGLEAYKKAIEDYTEAIKIAPKNADYYNDRGKAYLYLDNYKKAIEDHTERIKIDPGNAEYYNDRGDVYIELEDYKKAIEDYTEAIKIDPKNTMYYQSRGGAYYELEDYEEAIEDYTERIKINPNKAYYYQSRGDAYHDGLKDYKKAIEDYTKAIKINPKRAYYYKRRGDAYNSLKKKYEGVFFNDPEYEKYNRKAQADYAKAKELRMKIE